jgi:reactive chlorine resistance protein C
MFADHATAPSFFGVRPAAALELGTQAESTGLHVTRYSVALVLIWVGAMKFTAYEAGAIQPLIANSPLMSWLYALLGVQATSNLIGVAEIAAGVLIALRPWSAMACVVGSLMGIATFVITLTFLFSTPGWEPSLGGFPALSVTPGQFILKDAVLLGAAIWSCGEALKGVGAGRQRS